MNDGFLGQYDLAYDATFLKRVQMAMVKIAKAIQAEDPLGIVAPPGVKDQDPKQAVHDARIRLAYKVLYEPERYAKIMSQAVAVNPVITDKSPDGDIEFELSASWNAFSLGAPS